MGYSQNSLIGCIYDMALGHANWDNILDVMSASLPGCAIIVSGDDLINATNVVFSQRGLKPAAVADYIATYASLNPWLPGQADFPPLQVYHDDEIMARADSHKTRYFTEWLAPQGDFGAGTGMVLLREGTKQLTISVRYPESRQVRDRPRAAAILNEAASHFSRAFEISSRSRFSAGNGYLDSVVGDLPFPVFFVREDMRIQYCNFHAESMRHYNSGPFSSADGMLRATEPQADAELRQLVQKTIASRRTPTSVLQIAGRDAQTRYLAVARLANRSTELYQLHFAILDPGPLVMLVVHANMEEASLPTDLLWRAFSLTDSEAALAEALLKGATLGDFAKEREVSKQTLRNQLVGVMRKTGTRRQSELVCLLTRLALTCF